MGMERGKRLMVKGKKIKKVGSQKRSFVTGI